MARPEPVLDEARAARWLYAAGPLAVAALTAPLARRSALACAAVAVGVVGAAAGFLMPLQRARRVRELVTPSYDPRDDDGRLLRPITISTDW